ncbi:hypothetical protein OBV_28550 [Oscillibacter valericigenes Sjm18-20]|nr:hypothetical protein OBV_28550 [Oscillibacter valericigenes Sjm18-20]
MALCALVWPSNVAGENVPAESTVSAMTAEKTEGTTLPESASPVSVNHADLMAEVEGVVIAAPSLALQGSSR